MGSLFLGDTPLQGGARAGDIPATGIRVDERIRVRVLIAALQACQRIGGLRGGVRSTSQGRWLRTSKLLAKSCNTVG
jgi:hypothetical protein